MASLASGPLVRAEKSVEGYRGEPDIATSPSGLSSVVASSGDAHPAGGHGVVVEKGRLRRHTASCPRARRRSGHDSEGKKIEAEFWASTRRPARRCSRQGRGLPALAAGRAGRLARVLDRRVGFARADRGVTRDRQLVRGQDRLTCGDARSSGGPVVDANGRLVGLLRGIYMERGRRLPVPRTGAGRLRHGPSNRAEALVGMAWPFRRFVMDVAGQIKGQRQGRARLAGRRHRRTRTAGP